MATSLEELLEDHLHEQAVQATIHLAHPDIPESNSFSATHISPEGHLLTAFHALKPAGVYRQVLDIDVELLRVQDQQVVREPLVITFVPEWSDHQADWAVVKVNRKPQHYLPLAKRSALERLKQGRSRVLAYGYSQDKGAVGSIGGYQGDYAKALSDRRQFRASFINRGPGQSGGPVIDVQERAVVGVISGYRPNDEILTADAAAVDGTLLQARTGLPLASWADEWHADAARYLVRNRREFRSLTTRSLDLSLPADYLPNRAVTERVLEGIDRAGHRAVLLHGAPGSGKTSLALEVARASRETLNTRDIFWYDFEELELRDGEDIIPCIAGFLLAAADDYSLTDAFAQEPDNRRRLLDVLHHAIPRSRCVYVFENVHFALRRDNEQVLLLLAELAASVQSSDCESLVISTSWDRPPANWPVRIQPVDGFEPTEVQAFLSSKLPVSEHHLAYIRQYASDITLIRLFALYPDWRTAVEQGEATPAEPEEVILYWMNRFLTALPSAAKAALLAMAVLERPASQEEIEHVSGLDNAYPVLSQLLQSPPILSTQRRDAEVSYSAHLNVRRAIGQASGRGERRRAQTRAATLWTRRGEYLPAARALVAADDVDQALETMHSNRDAILGEGGFQELSRMLTNLEEHEVLSRRQQQQIWIIRASCNHLSGNYETAVVFGSLAIRHSNDPLEQVSLFNRRADSFRQLSRYGEADEDYRRAAALCARILSSDEVPSPQVVTEQARAFVGQAKLARLAGAYPRALKSYRDAHEIYITYGDRSGRAETSFGQGEVYRLLNQFGSSNRAYSESLTVARSLRSIERQAYGLWGLGEVARLRGDLEKARLFHLEGLDHCRTAEDTRSEGWALLGLGETLRAGHPTSGGGLYRAARDRFELTRSRTEIAHTLIAQSEVLRASGLYRAAIDQARAAVLLYEQRSLQHCLAQARLALAASLMASGAVERGRRVLYAALAGMDRYGFPEADDARRMLQTVEPHPPIHFNFP